MSEWPQEVCQAAEAFVEAEQAAYLAKDALTASVRIGQASEAIVQRAQAYRRATQRATEAEWCLMDLLDDTVDDEGDGE